jgi:DnaK suppressor protein
MFVETTNPRQKLEKERADLEAYIRSHINQRKETHYSSDPADAATDVCEQGLQIALVCDAERRFQEVEKALRRIDEGTYRLCEGCGQPIDVERLAALPSASRCVSCQQKREAQWRSRRNGHYLPAARMRSEPRPLLSS